MRCTIIPLIVLLAACGNYRTQTGDTDTADGTDDGTSADGAEEAPADGEDVPAEVVEDAVVDTVVDTEDDCPAVPPGCVDYCANEDGDEAVDIGVQIRRCTVETDERGCPYLDWTTEDCRPGTCDAATHPPACVPEHECSSGTCTCPPGARCTSIRPTDRR